MSIGKEGHRERLRRRFLQAGRAGVSEHELVELLLCFSIPRRDVKPLAKELLNRFGSLEALFAAGDDQLAQSSGIGEHTVALFKLLRTIWVEIMSRPLRSGIDLSDPEKVLEYLKLNCRRNDREVLQLLLLDRNRCLLETLTLEGDGKYLSVNRGKVLFKILCCRGAKQVIVAHNHLNDIPHPSVYDVSGTLLLKELLQNVGITLLDHFVITPQKCISMMKMAAPLHRG